MANRYPLIVDTTDGNKIKEIPSGDTLQLTGNSIIGVTDVTASGTIAGGVLSAASIMKGGTELASLAVTGAWSDVVGKPTQLSDFNNNLNFIVPGSNISILTNNAGYISTVAFSDLTTTPTTLAGYNITDGATSVQGALAGTAVQPGTNISTLFNNAGYLTAADLADGAITIDVNNTGDLVGSVFADDSTVMIDSILAAVNLDGTIRGNVSPNANQHNLWDLGSNAVRFKDAYFAGNLNVDGTISASTGDLEIQAPANIALYPTDNIWISQGTKLIFEGTDPDDFEVKVQATVVTADRDIILPDAGGTFAVSATAPVTLSATGDIGVDSTVVVTTVQQLSGPGAIDVISLITEITTTGTDAYTLADGVLGQIKIILATDVSGGTGTVTPTTVQGGTTLTFDAVGESITLIYTSLGWMRTAGAAGVLG